MKAVSTVVCIATLCAACVTPSFAMGGKEVLPKVEQIKRFGKIRLGTSADYPPYEFHIMKSGKDTIVGFDISIGEEIAKELDVKLEIVDTKFDGLLDALNVGEVDLVIAGMIPTQARRDKVDFSKIYYYASQGVLIRGGDGEVYSTLQGLSSAQLGAQKGTIQVDLAKTKILGLSESAASKAHPRLKELGTIRDLVQELKEGRVDAVVCELPVAQAYAKQNPDLAVSKLVFTDDSGSAVAVHRGDADLLAQVNAVLDRLITSKTIDDFVAQANELVEN